MGRIAGKWQTTKTMPTCENFSLSTAYHNMFFLQADPEWRELEFKKSMQRRNNLFLPQRISAAVTTLGWLFVGGGIILNALGYAWVKDPSGGLGVGTLDERDFQREVIREQRRANKEMAEEQPTTTVSKLGNPNNNYISSWLEKEADSQIAWTIQICRGPASQQHNIANSRGRGHWQKIC